MIRQVLSSLFKKPATNLYPFNKFEMPDKFRGKIVFDPELCVGCKLCMKDCPAGAINIKKVGEKKFEAEFDLGKCVYCAQCTETCFKKALKFTGEFELASLDREKLKITFNAKPDDTASK